MRCIYITNPNKQTV